MAVNFITPGPVFTAGPTGPNRYVTSGELAAGAGTGDAQRSGTNWWTGLNTFVAVVTLSGGALVAGALYAQAATGPNRYVTSGELSQGGGSGDATRTQPNFFTAANVFANTVTISGATLHLAPIHQGSVTGANRYITSGELQPDTNTGVVNTASVFWTGASYVFSAATNLTISGATLHLAPVHQGSVAGPNRYITSGELRPDTGITSFNTLTATSQTFATSATGNDFAITSAGSTHTFALPDAGPFSRGLLSTGAQTVSGTKVLADALTVVGSLTVSGTALYGAPVYQGSVSASLRYVTSGELRPAGTGTVTSISVGANLVQAPTPITTSGSIALAPNVSLVSLATTGDVLISGSALHFGPVFQRTASGSNRYLTSGELAAAGTGTVTSIAVGANLIAQPSTITGSGSIALQPSIQLVALGLTGDLLVSGTALHFGPIFQGAQAGSNRYLTSGELKPDTGITTLNSQTGTSQSFATSSAGNDFVISSAGDVHTFAIPSASAFARGVLTVGTQTISGAKTFAAPITAYGATISGTGLAYGPLYQGSIADAQRYVTSGELRPDTGVLATNSVFWTGAAHVFSAATSLTVSGTTLHLSPIHHGSVAGPNRYVTSGELKPDTGITSINSQTGLAQTLVTASTGNDFAITSAGDTHTFALPDAGAFSRGLLSINAQAISGSKAFAAPLVARSDFQASGVTIAYAPIHQGFASGATRYVTSGELRPDTGITTLNTLTDTSQTFATGTAGNDFNISSVSPTHTFNVPDASAFARGLVTTGTQTVSGVKTFAAPLVALGSVQISGSAIHYAPIFQGVAGGATRYVTSGELAAAAGSGTVTSIGVGSNLIQQPSPITVSGTIALSPNITVSTAVVAGDILASGTTLHFGPVFQGLASGPTRYVTSGELPSAGGGDATRTAPNFWTANNVFAPGAVVTLSGLTQFGATGNVLRVSPTDVQVSGGTLVSFAPIYQRAATGSNRYVTSGELPALVGWAEVTGTSQSMAVNAAYIASNASLVTLTLPSGAPMGSVVRVAGKGLGGWRIAQGSSQTVLWMTGSAPAITQTTSGATGRIDSTDPFDAIELLCLTQHSVWGVLSAKGNMTLV